MLVDMASRCPILAEPWLWTMTDQPTAIKHRDMNVPAKTMTSGEMACRRGSLPPPTSTPPRRLCNRRPRLLLPPPPLPVKASVICALGHISHQAASRRSRQSGSTTSTSTTKSVDHRCAEKKERKNGVRTADARPSIHFPIKQTNDGQYGGYAR